MSIVEEKKQKLSAELLKVEQQNENQIKELKRQLQQILNYQNHLCHYQQGFSHLLESGTALNFLKKNQFMMIFKCLALKQVLSMRLVSIQMNQYVIQYLVVMISQKENEIIDLQKVSQITQQDLDQIIPLRLRMEDILRPVQMTQMVEIRSLAQPHQLIITIFTHVKRILLGIPLKEDKIEDCKAKWKEIQSIFQNDMLNKLIQLPQQDLNQYQLEQIAQFNTITQDQAGRMSIFASIIVQYFHQFNEYLQHPIQKIMTQEAFDRNRIILLRKQIQILNKLLNI